jgi:hypothetical protein
VSCVGPHDFNLGCAVRNLTFFSSDASDASDGTLCRNLVLRKEYDLSNENVRGLFDREMFPRISFTERTKNAHNTHLYADRGPRVLNSEGYMYFHLPFVVSITEYHTRNYHTFCSLLYRNDYIFGLIKKSLGMLWNIRSGVCRKFRYILRVISFAKSHDLRNREQKLFCTT